MAGRSGSTSTLQIAQMMKDQAYDRYISQHASELQSASEGEKRRIRRNAKQHAQDSYVKVLEDSIKTMEAEKSSLTSLLGACEAEKRRLQQRVRQ